MRKKLIEVALPLEAINTASAAEKANPFIRGHPRTIHTWFARRPLVACRAVIFSSLVDDPDDPNAPPEFVAACRKLPARKNALVEDTPRQRLFDFIELLVQWESTTDEDVLETARELIRLSTDGNPPPLLDPFAGGGSIPLEAQRLGLEAHASDLNPVAVMINKALIEIPPRFADMPPVNPRDRDKIGGQIGWEGAQGLAADLRYYGEQLQHLAEKQLKALYPTAANGETVFAWLWARTVRCPNPACGATIPLITTFELSKKSGKRAWIEPQIDRQNLTVSFSVRQGKGKIPPPPKIGRGVKFRCLVCGEIASDQYISGEGIQQRIATQLIAIVAEAATGLRYYAPSVEHEQIAQIVVSDDVPDTPLPGQALGFRVQRYGISRHRDLFTPRQLAGLSAFRTLNNQIFNQVRKDATQIGMGDDNLGLDAGGTGALAYAEAIYAYLTFALDRWTDYSTTLCQWNTTNENIKHTFGRNALPMVWDFAEVNLFSGKLGFLIPVNWVASVLEELLTSNVSSGRASQHDAKSPGSFEPYETVPVMISTDPPYYDNIGYADLSDFYYVWLRPDLLQIYPELFGTVLVPKASELIASPSRFEGKKDAADEHFETGLRQSFAHMRRVLNPNYPLTVFYAFKQSESTSDDKVDPAISSSGWEKMLSGLVDSGFTVLGTWPVRTERSSRVRDIGSNALASSIVLVCRPRPDDAPQTSRREFVNALRRELPNALRDMQSGSIAPVDLAQASIGPGMAIYSRYSRVLEADGTPMTVRTALQLINQELDAFLAETEGDVDSDTRFCINWFEQFGFGEDEFGRADVLARAKNTSVDGLVNAGVLVAGAGRVRLYQWEELDPGWTPQEDARVTVWEAVHHLIERLNTHGESGAAALLLRMNSDLAAEAKNLAYRLYQICDRKSWADHALDYNALVQSWPRLQELANELKQNQPPEQLGMF